MQGDSETIQMCQQEARNDFVFQMELSEELDSTYRVTRLRFIGFGSFTLSLTLSDHDFVSPQRCLA